MKKIIISNPLTLNDIRAILYDKVYVEIDDKIWKEIHLSFSFLEDFSKNNIIYGINTGFGPMAQYRIDNKSLKELQYNIIRSHSTGAGEPLGDIYVRALILSRLCTFLKAKSGVNPQMVQLILDFLNNGIYPIIPQHGSVGASGDLVQLAHLALALIGEGKVRYKGRLTDTKLVFDKLNLKPFEISIREGLAVTNGTSCMTGIGLVNLFHARQLFKWSLITSVMMNEIASSYTDFLSEELNSSKCHEGQIKVAEIMRDIMSGSRCGRNRADELFGGKAKSVNGHFDDKVKVQPYYSLRCVPQILGPIYDEIKNAEKVLVNELNSACDNPIVDYKTKCVYHGGNFHGDYVSFEMDKLKIAITKLTMLAERQMNYLFHDRINGILPPFLNMGTLGLNYGMQACQFTATSTTAENQTLSNSMYVHSIPNNNDNQDIVSMGTNSALLAQRVIENSYQVMAIHMIANIQAIDCLKIADKIAPATRRIYDQVRKIVPLFIEDTTKYEDIANIIAYLKGFNEPKK
jgi:Histidine ammonia-lyase